MDTLEMPEVVAFLEARAADREADMTALAATGVDEDRLEARRIGIETVPMLAILRMYQRKPKVLKSSYRVVERRSLGLALLAHTLPYAGHSDFREEWSQAIG